MTDKLTPQQRHTCMSHIRGKDTKPEMIVRRWLWADGYRYRLHGKHMPGKPDIVMRKLRTVIFINGCFWHGHNVGEAADASASMRGGGEGGGDGVSVRLAGGGGGDGVSMRWAGGEANGGCGQSGVIELTDSDCCRIPRTNREFWLNKIRNNRQRDRRTYGLYLRYGWHVLVVWECMLRPKKREGTLMALSLRLNDIFLGGVRTKPKAYTLEEEDSGGAMAAEG